MSIVFLKNVLFPGANRQRNPANETPQNNSISSSPLEIDFTTYGQNTDKKCLSCKCGDAKQSRDSSVDVEAQNEDVCQPIVEKSHSRRRAFKLSPRMISDAIIGLSDGMTVPFALTAGLASLGDARLVVLGGLAELIAGAISMGLGGFIGAKSEAESYTATVNSTREMIETSPCQTSALVHSTFKPYGLSASTMGGISKSLRQSPPEMLDFLMRFHHQMPEPADSRPFVCAITIGISYFIGGLTPLIPYFCVRRNEVMLALWWSIGVMVVALFAFGWTKTAVVVGWRGKGNVLAGLRGALQMVMIGGIAAGAAVGLVRAINHGSGHI